MKEIIVRKECLPNIKGEKNFIAAIQFGRMLGAIRYNKILHVKIIEDEDMSTSSKLHILLIHAAYLFESIKKFNETKANFENLENYKKNTDKIDKILNEANDSNSFTNKVLKKIRNKIAFHFDEDVIEEVIGKFVDDSIKENKDVVLISGKSELVKDTTYLLADNMNINYVLGQIEGEEKSEKEKFIILSEKLLDLSGSFCELLDLLIPDLIIEYCEMKE